MGTLVTVVWTDELQEFSDNAVRYEPPGFGDADTVCRTGPQTAGGQTIGGQAAGGQTAQQTSVNIIGHLFPAGAADQQIGINSFRGAKAQHYFLFEYLFLGKRFAAAYRTEIRGRRGVCHRGGYICGGVRIVPAAYHSGLTAGVRIG